MRFFFVCFTVCIALLFLQTQTRAQSIYPGSQSTYTLVDSSITYKFSSLNDSLPYSKSIYATVDTVGEVRWVSAFRWDGATDSWEGDMKSYWYVNPMGKSARFLRWDWDKDSGCWFLKQKYNTREDEDGNIIEGISFYRSLGDSAWLGDQYVSTTYDSAGHVLLDLELEWDQSKDDWRKKRKTAFVYDSGGRVLEWTLWGRSTYGDSWVEQDRRKYSYEINDFQELSLYLVYTWYEFIEDWVMSQKVEYEYDANEQLVLTSTYNWSQEEGWIVYSKRDYTYDKNGNQLSYQLSRWVNQTWIGAEKEEYSFNSLGLETMKASYHNPYGNHEDWMGDDRTDRAYDEAGNLITYTLFNWVYETGSWEGFYRRRYWHDAANRIYYFNYETWNQDSLDWIPYTSNTNIYPDSMYRQIQAGYLLDENGMDSTLRDKKFFFANAHQFNSFANLCEGEEFQWRGKTYSGGGTYREVFKTELGADSIYSLELELHPLPESFEITDIEGNEIICQGQSGYYMAPGNPMVEYAWWSDDGEILSGENNDTVFFQWLAGAHGELKARSVNAHGCWSDTVSFTVEIAICDDVEEHSAAACMLYPVPVGERLFVKSDTPYASLEIFDIKGVCVLSSGLAPDGVDFSSLPAGTYFVRLINSSGSMIGNKVVIKTK